MHRGAALTLYDTVVASDWVDYNGHMNDAAYAVVFSRATDALMDRIGLDAAARKSSGRTLYTLQVMLHYLQEASDGAPLFVATSNPLDGAPWQHLLLAQDIGGAIKGPVRGDIFFGWGTEAEAMAGRMKQPGTAYLLLPRTGPGV